MSINYFLQEPLTPFLKPKLINIFVTLLALLFVPQKIMAQEPLKHKKVIYKGADGKLYINKSLPLYLKISTSPDEEAESWLLESTSTSQYANPMYLDTEGWNTIRSPWAVDTTTHKVKYPHQDIIFDVYADGIPPVSKMVFGQTSLYRTGEIIFVGNGKEITFKGKDEMSGLADFFYSINGSDYKSLKENPLNFEAEKKYEVLFYALDNVGNAEKPQQMTFVVDKTAPVSDHSIEGINKDGVVAPDALIILKSKDTVSGVKNIFYAINDGEFLVYQKPIPVSLLSDDQSTITFYAEDQVGNKEEPKVIGTISSGNKKDTEEDIVFDYYIDREAPVVSLRFEGDLYQGKHNYISGRTRVVLSAKDDKSGVKEILYSYNSFLTKEKYTEAFMPKGDNLVKISYSAQDWVNNTAKEKVESFFIDRVPPTSKVTFNGPLFRNRDTIFISRNTLAKISTIDKESGVKKVIFKLNGKESLYGEPFNDWKHGLNRLEWSSVDQVNNAEEPQEMVFVMDDEPPVIYFHFSVEPIGEKVVRGEKFTIYPSNTKLYLGATDNITGEETLQYSINGGIPSNKLPVEGLIPANYEVVIEAVDALQNKAVKTIKFAIEK